jgi:hypothetical protein
MFPKSVRGGSMSWIPVHEEQPRADLSVEAWLNDDKNNLIFVRGDRGLRYSVYSCMEDALDGNSDFALANVCYGWYTLLWEKSKHKAHDDFLDDCDTRSKEAHGIAFECHNNPGECDDAFHAAQVILGNAECEGCEICKEEGVQC